MRIHRHTRQGWRVPGTAQGVKTMSQNSTMRTTAGLALALALALAPLLAARPAAAACPVIPNFPVVGCNCWGLPTLGEAAN